MDTNLSINDILIDDILNIIIPLAKNYYCLTTCKKWYSITLKNPTTMLCHCGRIKKIYGEYLWYLPIVKVPWTGHSYKYFSNACYCEHKLKFDCIITLLRSDYNILNKYDNICFALSLIAVKITGHALKYFSQWDLTPIIAFEAVRKTGSALQYIPEKLQTVDICLRAVQTNGLALQYVKNPTKYICIEAVRQHGFALQYVKNPTKYICMEAMKQNYSSYKCIKNIEIRDILRIQWHSQINNESVNI